MVHFWRLFRDLCVVLLQTRARGMLGCPVYSESFVSGISNFGISLFHGVSETNFAEIVNKVNSLVFFCSYFVSSPKRKTPIEEYPFMCKAENLGQNKSKGYPCTLPKPIQERISIHFSPLKVRHCIWEQRKRMAQGQLLENEQ